MDKSRVDEVVSSQCQPVWNLANCATQACTQVLQDRNSSFISPDDCMTLMGTFPSFPSYQVPVSMDDVTWPHQQLVDWLYVVAKYPLAVQESVVNGLTSGERTQVASMLCPVVTSTWSSFYTTSSMDATTCVDELQSSVDVQSRTHLVATRGECVVGGGEREWTPCGTCVREWETMLNVEYDCSTYIKRSFSEADIGCVGVEVASIAPQLCSPSPSPIYHLTTLKVDSSQDRVEIHVYSSLTCGSASSSPDFATSKDSLECFQTKEGFASVDCGGLRYREYSDEGCGVLVQESGFTSGQCLDDELRLTCGFTFPTRTFAPSESLSSTPTSTPTASPTLFPSRSPLANGSTHSPSPAPTTFPTALEGTESPKSASVLVFSASTTVRIAGVLLAVYSLVL